MEQVLVIKFLHVVSYRVCHIVLCFLSLVHDAIFVDIDLISSDVRGSILELMIYSHRANKYVIYRQ